MSDSVTWREYIDERFKSVAERFEGQEKAVAAALAAQEKAVAAALVAAEKAVSKAELASEKRFESVNEFRAALADQARTFLPRAEFEAAHASLVDKVEALQKLIWIGTGVVLAVQFLIGIMLVFWRKP